MGSAVNAISNGITQVRDSVNNATGTRVGDLYTGIATGGIDSLIRSPNAPEAPATDPALTALQKQQMKNAKDFRENMGNTRSRLTQDLTAQNNSKMNADLHTTDENSNARGLLYGGMNAGARAGVRANAQGNLAAGIGTINNGLEDAANTLDQQAVSTGQAIQKSQQDIQNQIYSQALAQQNAQNSIFGSAAGAGLMRALV